MISSHGKQRICLGAWATIISLWGSACGSTTDGKSSGNTDTDTASDARSTADADTDTSTDSDTAPPAQVTLNETGFEGYMDEMEFVKSSWEEAGFDPRWVGGFDQGRAHVDTAVSHNGVNALRIDYPAGGVGPSETGVQVPLDFSGLSEAYVSFALMFSDNFDWGGDNEGGKLPGLGSGDNCSGGATCDGTNGFSARLMWRTGGQAVLYLYHMDKPDTYGENFPLVTGGDNIVFQKGQWYEVTERVKINTGDNRDGEVQIWVNGEEALRLDGIRFVNNGDLIDNLYFSTFHGGNDTTWSPGVDCHVWFDDVRIFKVDA